MSASYWCVRRDRMGCCPPHARIDSRYRALHSVVAVSKYQAKGVNRHGRVQAL